jgi:hypothetical protein
LDRLGPHPGATAAGGQVGQVANPELLAGPLGGLHKGNAAVLFRPQPLYGINNK